MRQQWNVLVASSSMEDRASLMHILDSLSLNVISCSEVTQAQEVLARQDVPLVFCDERLADGGYRDLLACTANRKPPRIVVTIRTGDWDQYLDAMRQGAYDAIRFPLQPTDVELVVLRAMRENREAGCPAKPAGLQPTPAALGGQPR